MVVEADYSSYIHRLIQSRNGGKLVELPSASSLVTPSFARLATPQQINPSRSTSSPLDNTAYHTGAGPSNDDLEKISTIESITLEYSYLLSSQLEAMRQHYESQTTDHKSRLAALEDAHARARESGKAKEDAEKAREKAERRAEKATELSRSLQASLSAEKAMSQGLSTRVTTLRKDAEKMERESKEREEVKKELEEVKRDLEETLRDLMFSLEAGAQIQANGGGAEGGEGGSLVVVRNDKEKKKKKGKK